MRRAVITGIGLVTPCGLGTAQTWAALLEGRSGIRPITRFDATGFDTRFAGEVDEWDSPRFVTPKRQKEVSRFIEYALGATAFAWEDAGLGLLAAEEQERAGCIVGAGFGGLEPLVSSVRVLDQEGPRMISAYALPTSAANFAPAQIAIRHGLRGPNRSINSACASGADAIGEAMRLIRHDDADLVVAGGTEASITPVSIGAFMTMRAMSVRNDAPESARRPWDKDRDGIVIGEGAGILVIEELERAKARGARLYAEVLGYGSCNDAFHITQPRPEGAQRAMRLALKDARIAVERVGYINAHATGTVLGDLNESRAIEAVFGPHTRSLAVSGTKSMTGHMMGAAGAVELAIAALAVAHGKIPPTINLDEPGRGCDLDYVPHHARDAVLDAAISNAFGFGGANASLVVARV